MSKNFLEDLRQKLNDKLVKIGDAIKRVNPRPELIVWAGIVNWLGPFFKDEQKQHEAFAFGSAVLVGEEARPSAIHQDDTPANEIAAFDQGLLWRPFLTLAAQLLVQAIRGAVMLAKRP